MGLGGEQALSPWSEGGEARGMEGLVACYKPSCGRIFCVVLRRVVRRSRSLLLTLEQRLFFFLEKNSHSSRRMAVVLQVSSSTRMFPVPVSLTKGHVHS